MALEQQRVIVRLAGACDNSTGEGWEWRLRDGTTSRTLYPTAQAARRAGERAHKARQS